MEIMTPKSRQQIADELGIHISTLKRKIQKLDLEIPRGLIPPDLQEKLYEELGYKTLWDKMYRNELK